MWFIGVEVGQETSAPPPKKILDPPLKCDICQACMFASLPSNLFDFCFLLNALFRLSRVLLDRKIVLLGGLKYEKLNLRKSSGIY